MVTLQFCYIYLRAQIKASSVSTWVTSHEGLHPIVHLLSHCFCWWAVQYSCAQNWFAWRWRSGIIGEMSGQVNRCEDHWRQSRTIASSRASKFGWLPHKIVNTKHTWQVGRQSHLQGIGTTNWIQNPGYWRSHRNGSTKSIKICHCHYTHILKIMFMFTE